MRKAVFRTHIDFFLGELRDDVHAAWSVKAFRDRCIHEMIDAGFDMSRKIFCHYDSDSGDVTFWQEPTEAVNAALFNPN